MTKILNPRCIGLFMKRLLFLLICSAALAHAQGTQIACPTGTVAGVKCWQVTSDSLYLIPSAGKKFTCTPVQQGVPAKGVLCVAKIKGSGVTKDEHKRNWLQRLFSTK